MTERRKSNAAKTSRGADEKAKELRKRARTNRGAPPTSKVTDRSFTARDFVDLCILVAYIVQSRGQASIQDVEGVITGPLNSKVRTTTLSKILRAMNKKDILAVEYGGNELRYSMKRIKFNCNLEIAQVNDLIPTLKADTAGIAIMAELSGETKGPKPTKKPKNWVDYEVTLRLLRPWYGAQPLDGNNQLRASLRNHKFPGLFKDDQDPKTIPLMFERHPDGESLVVHKACVAGFIKGHLNRAGKSFYNVDLFDLEDIVVQVGEGRPNGTNLLIAEHPIQAPTNRQGATGAGMGYYEALQPGQIVHWYFSAPEKHFLSPAEMERWLRRVLKRNRRSMSPARGTQTGAAELVEFKFERWSDQDPKQEQE
jgi:hypothetical protein